MAALGWGVRAIIADRQCHRPGVQTLVCVPGGHGAGDSQQGDGPTAVIPSRLSDQRQIPGRTCAFTHALAHCLGGCIWGKGRCQPLCLDATLGQSNKQKP